LFPCQSGRPHDVTPTSETSSGSSTQSSDTAVTTSSYQKSVSSLKSKNPSLDTLSGPSSTSLTSVLDAQLRHPKPPDPQDHSRLRRAWEEMLDNSFLIPQLLSVLPFYLSSSFPCIRSHPPLQIPLPDSSSDKQQLITQHSTSTVQLDPATLFELRALSAQPSSEVDYRATAECSQRGMSSWACMHLARTVRTIMGCKESIWSAYERLYGGDPLPPVVRTAHQKLLSSWYEPSTNPLRDYFERDWINWEKCLARFRNKEPS
jgi:hypothetical protein